MRKLFATQSVQDGLLTNHSTVSGEGGGGGGGPKLWTLYSFPHPACVAENLQTEYKDKRMGHDRAYPTTLRDYTRYILSLPR